MSSAKMKIKKGDEVIVIAGKDKGKKGSVIRALPKESRVVVVGVNIVSRHTKPSQKNPEGGMVRKEASIHVSNIAIVDKASGKPSRVGYKISKDGAKQRITKRSGEVLNG